MKLRYQSIYYTISLVLFLASRFIVLINFFDSLYTDIMLLTVLSNVIDLLPAMYMSYTHIRMFKRES